MTVAVAALAALLLGLPASSYANRTVHVGAGESIQAAIDAAEPYTTIEIEEGTYSEALQIDKDGIKLVGEGRKKTNLTPSGSIPECVFAPAGICVWNAEDPDDVVKDVHISRLSVKGVADGFGIFYFQTKRGVIHRVIASDNGGYGIFVLGSSGSLVSRNVTSANGDAGIYVGGSENANATVWGNVSYDNALGIFIRDAANGKVVKNKVFSNCAGILFLNTDETAGPEPGPALPLEDWVAKHNNVTANNKVCPGEPRDRINGHGIVLISTIDVHVIGNGVFGNRADTPPPPEAVPSGGIIVVSDPTFPGQQVTGTKVAFNTALGNEPDIFWDETGGTTNTFFANDCLTSIPDGLCEDPAGDGDHGDDDDQHGGDRDHGDKKHKKGQKHKKGKKKDKKSKKHDRDDD
jgi:parallel beta-helix repeat protein